MANKIDILILLKKQLQIMSVYCMSCSTKSNKVKFCTLSFTCYFTPLIYVLLTNNNTINEQVFPIIIQENSNKSYIPSNGGSLSNDFRVFNAFDDDSHT